LFHPIGVETSFVVRHRVEAERVAVTARCRDIDVLVLSRVADATGLS